MGTYLGPVERVHASLYPAVYFKFSMRVQMHRLRRVPQVEESHRRGWNGCLPDRFESGGVAKGAATCASAVLLGDGCVGTPQPWVHDASGVVSVHTGH